LIEIHDEKIIILDFGSQYTQLIARKVREQKVYCEIVPYFHPLEKIKDAAGIILSGGPSSIYEDDAPKCDEGIFELGIPILGICYGMQLIANHFGGEIDFAAKREYGKASLLLDDTQSLFAGMEKETQVWMSHGDHITDIPESFRVIGHTENSPFAAVSHKEKPIFGIQFHPEVTHSAGGVKIIRNFLEKSCSLSFSWNMSSFVKYSVEKIREKVGQNHVLCGLSGGVDSSVAAVLVHRAIGSKLTCIFVDNGLLRKGEREKVEETFRGYFEIDLRVVDASEMFLSRLKSVTDPEKKRKIIGHTFIEVFENEAKKIGSVNFLVQGTLYPDVIESVSVNGPSATIKSHHNVGGLPEKMNFSLVEPLRELFKDEVRLLGEELDISTDIVYRQPFPGPGLAIRIIGEINEERLEILKNADAIVIEEIKSAGLYHDIWQSFAVLLPIKAVGVMGDARTYESVIALRAVQSLDGMTADWVKLPYEVLGYISNRIINEVRGVNRVVYDISSKPPGTIEWE